MGADVVDADAGRVVVLNPDGSIGRAGAWAEHSQVPAHSSAGAELLAHELGTESNTELVAGDAGLADLQQRRAPLPHITDAHLTLGAPGNGQVLAEQAE